MKSAWATTSAWATATVFELQCNGREAGTQGFQLLTPNVFTLLLFMIRSTDIPPLTWSLKGRASTLSSIGHAASSTCGNQPRSSGAAPSNFFTQQITESWLICGV